MCLTLSRQRKLWRKEKEMNVNAQPTRYVDAWVYSPPISIPIGACSHAPRRDCGSDVSPRPRPKNISLHTHGPRPTNPFISLSLPLSYISGFSVFQSPSLSLKLPPPLSLKVPLSLSPLPPPRYVSGWTGRIGNRHWSFSVKEGLSLWGSFGINPGKVFIVFRVFRFPLNLWGLLINC